MAMMEINSVKSANQFSYDIEMIVQKKRCDYLDAILLYIEERELEVETVAALVRNSVVIKSKLQAECVDMNLIAGATAKLPI